MAIKQPTIALTLIVKGTKDETVLLSNCLSNISGHVDAIYLNINHLPGGTADPSIIKIAKKYKATFITTEWTGNFVTARKDSFAMIPKEFDFILWLDTDDTIDKPEEIRKVIAVLSPKQHGIYIKYDYDHDEAGNTTVSHWVARIVRNNGTYDWKSSIADDTVAVHETLCEVLVRPKAMCEDFKVIHHAAPDRREKSLIRNITLLEGMLKRQRENGELDPRTLFYLATHYYDARNYKDAVGLLRDYLELSGWAEERCEAHVYLGNIYRQVGQREHAYEEYIRGLAEYQNSPRPYLELSELSYEMKRYQDSADWIEKSLKLPKPTTTMVQRPMESTFRAYLLAAQAYVNLGGKKLNDAKKYAYKALDLRPLDSDAQKARDVIEDLIEKREDIRAATRLIRKFVSDKTEGKIVPFIDRLPYDTQDNPLILNARHHYTDPKTWSNRSIVMYVGQGPLGVWGPWSLESGIGGSEEAVIKLSRELSNLGWNITIYATPGERYGRDGMYNVTWKQYYEFNPNDFYNILITWRNPWFFDADVKASKTYLWLHDVMEASEFTPERLEKIDKVIFVGQYHADLYKGIIPQDKWLVSGNGIDPQDFIDADGKFERVPHRMVYMSSYNRGLKILLDNWNTIKEAVPDAVLDVYYGWNSYDAINSENPERMQWKQEMVNLIKSCDGVTDHGRIGHKQIVEEINKADIFAYSCIFPEVYCISHVKAMAGGAYPVTTDYAELSHYKHDGGVQVHYEPGSLDKTVKEYIIELIKALKNTNKDRSIMINTTREKYSWESTAKQWNNEFNV